MTDSGELEQAAPPCLGKVPRDLLRNFPHTKRVGSYLVGKMINKGSFAKVMLGMHIITGEKVRERVSYAQTPVNQRTRVTRSEGVSQSSCAEGLSFIFHAVSVSQLS